MDLYISREYGSRYPAVRDLGIGATNAGKKVMKRGWVDREEVLVALLNIFDEIVPPSYLGIDTVNFVVVDKPKYDLVLESIEEQERGKSQYRYRKNLWKLLLSLHTFYELLFPEFIATDSDGEVILTKFFKCFHIYMKRNINLSEYYDSEYTKTESSNSETNSSDPETSSEDDMPHLIIYSQAFYSNPTLNEIFEDKVAMFEFAVKTLLAN
ncbi:1623_t:CDS:2 [Funneliformis mosseae]|uniref:1623_t:CDS:1 n=1 Tax=Funneliformis mosseae TaxID=27381 RepID=A0A9N9FZ93_FUNMO|nr:1623_t:CDS:2 [Funneliformis mosseae]